MRTFLTFLLAAVLTSFAQEPRPLEGAQPLTQEGDLSAAMVEGIDRWLMRETARLAEQRHATWEKTASSEAAWAPFADAKREQLRRMIGATDARAPAHLEVISEPGVEPGTAFPGGYSVQRVRWQVFDSLAAEGVLFLPKEARATVIAVPDADETPESFPMAHRLAAQGCVVLAPVLVDRRDTWSGSEALGRWTNQPHREWIHRQAFELGCTLIGFEVQKILAALDALTSAESKLKLPAGPVGIAGYGEGGLLALHCAALDTRFGAALVSGYFGPRQRLWEEPIYRNVFGCLRDFGDAELAALIAPRGLVIEDTLSPKVSGPPPPEARRKGAAPGFLQTNLNRGSVFEEAARAKVLSIGRPVILVASPDNDPPPPAGSVALENFLGRLGHPKPTPEDLLQVPRPPPNESFLDQRQRRTVRDLERFTQSLLRDAERERERVFWAKLKDGAELEAAQRERRARLWEESIGKITAERLPLNPRSRVVLEREKWVAHEVVLDVLPDLFAWGWLLVPRDLQPGERRPVVVCQHGLEGVPADVVNDDSKSPAFRSYKAFAARLADRGFIVFAPHNPYRGQDKFRVLQRKANPLGLSLFSFILAQHEAALDWLATLPFVDEKRIGFYGLSYGGKTAMRVPALLDRYCLSICSGDFNEWIFKNVSTDFPGSYMFTGEYEMPEWNLAHVANYAEMAMLIAPRPFMVERGHDDGVAVDEWVAYEYAKVRRGYVKLGIGERTEIEWFNGPHTIHGVGTFHFLHKHLAWPVRK